MIDRLFLATFTFAFLISVAIIPAAAQTPEKDRVLALSEEITLLMNDLEIRAAEYPAVLEALEQGKINIEKADETVKKLIEHLTAITDKMEDKSEFDLAIDDYIGATMELISEAEASGNDDMKNLIPTLNRTLEQLKNNDELRAQTVVDARNLIRQLEKNSETFAFYIKAGEVQKAANLISSEVGIFADIVKRGKGLARSLTEASNP